MEVANVIIPEMTLRMYLIQKEIIRYMGVENSNRYTVSDSGM